MNYINSIIYGGTAIQANIKVNISGFYTIMINQ